MSQHIGELHLIQELNIFQTYFSKQQQSSFLPITTNFCETEMSNFTLAKTVSRIIENGSNGVVPNWIALKNELYENRTKTEISNHPLSKDFCFSPKLVSYIIVRQNITKLELFEKYQIVFIPGFDNYIVTLHSKNPKTNATEQFAIGSACGYMSPKNAAMRVVSEFNKTCVASYGSMNKLMLLESGLMDFEEMNG